MRRTTERGGLPPAGRRNLRSKILLLGLSGVTLTAIVLVLLAAWLSGQYNNLAQKEVDELIAADLDHITQGVYNLVRTEDEAVQQQVDGTLQMARYVLQDAGGLAVSRDTVEWTVRDQGSPRTGRVVLPRVLIGGRWLRPTADARVVSPVVDDVARLTGGMATIFQRMNAQGDMVRIATTVLDDRGARAIGTYIPHQDPDGVPDPVVSTVLSGKTFRGRAFVLDEWYLTAYEPLRDAGGEIIGMLFVGVSVRSVEARIRQTIINTVVGKTGYVFVLGGKGREKGRYIISQYGERDGENIWDSRDSDGRLMIQDIIGAALALGPGEMATQRYRWQNPGDPAPRWKIARLAYYEPWDWVIGTSTYEDELERYRTHLERGRTRMTVAMAAAGGSITLLLAVLATLFASSIVRPLRRMTIVARNIAHGDLSQRVEQPAGDEIGALALSFNLMTDRLRRTLDGLRQSELEFRGIFESAIEGLFQSTYQGKFVKANSALARILGYDSPDDLIASVTDIKAQLYVHPEDRDALFAELRAHGEVRDRELLFRRRDGSEMWVSVSERLVRDEAGGLELIQGFIEDISERKRDEERRRRLEERLRQAQKMETVGLLAGGVAHDFNNLLRPILGYAELLMDVDAPEASRLQQLNEIRLAANRAQNLTQQLLAFSRKQMIELKRVNLGNLVRRFEGILRRAIRENVTIDLRLPPELGAVRADPGQIEQVLLNLCVNAQDAMPGGGALVIEAMNVTLDETYANQHPDSLPGPHVMLSVSDTGAGMDARTIEHLFEPFFTTKEMGRGTGLGLSTVYGIVQQHGVSIAVYSEPGHGSTFKVYLPREPEEAAAPERVEQVRVLRRGSETILVVEDNTMVRTLACGMLERLGYRVLTAEDVHGSIEAADSFEGAIDLLLTDVVMPEINGIELYRMLKAKRPNLKVLFMSGYSGDVLGQHGILDEGITVIQKPFTMQALSQKIGQVIDGRR